MHTPTKVTVQQNLTPSENHRGWTIYGSLGQTLGVLYPLNDDEGNPSPEAEDFATILTACVNGCKAVSEDNAKIVGENVAEAIAALRRIFQCVDSNGLPTVITRHDYTGDSITVNIPSTWLRSARAVLDHIDRIDGKE